MRLTEVDDIHVVVHLRPAEVLVESGVTHGVIKCTVCGVYVEHYVTGPVQNEDGVSETISWRCTKCDELADLDHADSLTAIYAREVLNRYQPRVA
jgi:hypothetical protein